MKRLALVASLLALVLAGCGSTKTVVHTAVVPERPAMPLQYLGQQCPTSLLPVCHGGRYRDPALFKAPPTKRLLEPPGATRSTGGLIYGYDTVSLQYVPANAAAVAGYVDGYANCSQVFSQFPNAHKYCYAIHAYDRGDCLDMEPGAAYPSQEVAWVRNELAHRSEWSGRIKAPCLYSMESWMGSIIAYANQGGLRYGTDYTLVTAAWNGVGNVPAGRDGHQYKSNCCLDWDVWNASFFKASKPPVPHMSGTANGGGVFSDKNWSWGAHGTTGTWKAGSENYWASAEMQFGRSGNVRIKPMPKNSPPLGSGPAKSWATVPAPTFAFGYHFNASRGTWIVWHKAGSGALPQFPKGCDRLSAELQFNTRTGEHRVRKMGCDAGPLFGAHGP